ncbi:MAG: hypothetical protein U5J95_00925 [Balneolaceae bacterium]|nr:hypothetical protein [Balneolaceae bacterium]
MKYFKNSAIKLLLGFLLIGFATNATAQNRAAAVQAYNQALDLQNAENYQQAIDMFSQAKAQAQQAEDAGEKGQDIIELVNKKLPRLYYNLAGSKYSEFQQDKTMANLDATIDAFKEARGIAEEYNDEEFASKSSQVVTKLLYSKSILQYRNKNHDAALATLDQVTERDPNYAQAYYQKAIVIKNKPESTVENYLAAIDKAIEVGNANNPDVVSQAKESVVEELVYRGANATENKNYSRAEDLLNKALNYDAQNANVHYRLAEAYNKQVKSDQAISHARKALDYENGGRTARAKIYFELATALKIKGNIEEACSAFKNAAYGEFKSPAEHQMEYELKCDSATN